PDPEPAVATAAGMAIEDPAVRPALMPSRRRQEEFAIEFAQSRDGGPPRWLEVRMAPVVDADGQPALVVGVVTDITARRQAAEEMAFRASHDALTGLANRDLLLATADEAIARERPGVVVCHIDLDRFQLVNDSLGHEEGDRLLVAVSRRLAMAAGEGALVARMGGDEFGVLLQGVADDDLAARVDALREAVAVASDFRGVALHVTPSI